MPSPVLALTLTRVSSSSERMREARADRLPVRRELRLLHQHRAVDVHDPQPAGGDHRHHRAQQLDRVGVTPALVGVGEVLADVAQPGGAEQRVGDGVGEHVGVRVSLQAELVGDLHPADHEPAPGARRWES